MAIGTNDLIDKFGTQDTVTTTGGSTADGAFTNAGTWTNDDDAPMAAITFRPTFSVAPDTGSYVGLYAQLEDVQSTNDDEVPSASFLHTFLGDFPVDDVTSAQTITIRVALPNAKTSQVYDFYIENRAGQTISVNWELYVTPIAQGPAA